MDVQRRETESARSFLIQRVWNRGTFSHICFESIGCRFRKNGHCIMCDYGSGRNVSAQEAVDTLSVLISHREEPLHRLLLGTCGSILDEREMERSVLGAILAYLKETDIQTIIFETHYSTVTEEILRYIQNQLWKKQIIIEMGLESANQDVLRNHLKKYMDLEALSETIKRIQKFGMKVSLNVFLGAPGLSRELQLVDTKQAIKWAYQHKADEIVLFPANIKPNTKLWDMYQKGKYQPITHEMIYLLLSDLPDEQLGIMAISWFGDRQMAGEDLDIVPPYAEVGQQMRWIDFYKKFMQDFDVKKRKKLLYDMMDDVKK